MFLLSCHNPQALHPKPWTLNRNLSISPGKVGYSNVAAENATASKKADETKVKDIIQKSDIGFEAVNASVKKKSLEWVMREVKRFFTEG